MEFFAVLRELSLVLLIVAVVLFLLAIGLCVHIWLLKRRFKKQARRLEDAKEKSERQNMEIVTLRGEIEAIRAIQATGELPPQKTEEDEDASDAPLYLDEVLDPKIFEPTVDERALKAKPKKDEPLVFGSSKGGIRYYVEYDSQKQDWVVRKDGQARAVRRLASKQEAVLLAKELSSG